GASRRRSPAGRSWSPLRPTPREAAPRRVAVAEQDLVLLVVEEPVRGGLGIGHRHGQRLLGAGVDGCLDLLAQGRGIDAGLAHARLLAVDRVLLAPLLDLLLG